MLSKESFIPKYLRRDGKSIDGVEVVYTKGGGGAGEQEDEEEQPKDGEGFHF